MPDFTEHTDAAGEKLSESTAGDVRTLCTTLLNCYLIQLLESGCACELAPSAGCSCTAAS